MLSLKRIKNRKRAILWVVAIAAWAVVGWQVYAKRHFWADVYQQIVQVVQPSEAVAQSGTRPLPQGPTFDLRNPTIPLGEIRSGGPPKDGIPALTNPKHVSANVATFLKREDRLAGVAIGAQSRAYPLKILNYHEIVNDRLGETPIAVTYCPLCDSVAVFDRRTKIGERDFGVSGLLFNSNVLMYDRGGATEGLWSQIKAEGVSGPGAKTPLTALPVELTTWKDWLARHPETTVLSTETGHQRNYQQSPYQGYFETPRLMFPVKPLSRRLPTKAPVLGVWTQNASRAYPLSAFGREPRRLEQELAGRKFVIEFDPAAQSAHIASADDGVQWMYSLWFAWYAFRPETDVFK